MSELPAYWIVDRAERTTLAWVEIDETNATFRAKLVDGSDFTIGSPELAVALGRCLIMAGSRHANMSLSGIRSNQYRGIQSTLPL